MKRITGFIVALILILSALGQSIENYSYEEALISNNIRSLAIDDDGDIWIGTFDGLTRFDGTTFTSYTTADGLGGNMIYDLHVHSSGTIYVATSGGLSLYDGDFWLNYTMGDGLPSNIIWSVTEDADGKVWVGTSGDGIAYRDGGIWHTLSTADGLVSNQVRSIFGDRSGNIWCGTGNGISIYDGSSFTTHSMATGMPGTLINDIIQLDNGNIAVATNGGIGIYNYSFWDNILVEDGLPIANILSLKQDYEMNLVMASALGLIIYDWTDFEIFNYENGLVDDIVTKIEFAKAGDNRLVLASPFDGITIYDYEDNYIIYRTNRNLVNDNINFVLVDNDGIVWAATQGGLNRIDDFHWRTFNAELGLIDDNIKTIFKDNDGNIWMGTENGISILNGQDITNITISDGLTDNNVHGITADGAGLVYVATEHSITILDNMIVTDTIGFDDGLLDSIVKNIHFEGGRLWLLFNEGIQYFDGFDFIDVTNDGCASDQNMSMGVCYNCPEGEQYFGTDYSLRYFENGTDISDCWEHPYPGTALITSIVLTDDGLICSFDNGEVHLFDGAIWSDVITDYPVYFLAAQTENYIWWGYLSDGLGKECVNCNETIDYTAIAPDCHGVQNASLQIDAPIGAYEYSINNGQSWQVGTLFENLSGGYKHVLVRNTSFEIVADEIIYMDYYDQFNEAHITLTQIDCFGNDNGAVSLFYDFAASHEWENGNTVLFDRFNLEPGIYSVTISDNANCEKIIENTIIEPAVLQVGEFINDVDCFGAENAFIELIITGGTTPYTIDWNTGQTESEITDLSGGNYAYTVTDVNLCFVEGSVEIFEPTELIVNHTIEDVFCYGGSTGSIELEIEGGMTEYTIEWSPDVYEDINGNIINAIAGDYNLTVTDNNNCEFTATYTIEQPDVFDITDDEVINVFCYGEETGSIEITVTGGFGNYLFLWEKEGEAGVFSEEQNLSDLGVGIYNITITDENMCEAHGTYEITQMPELTVELEVIPISCSGYEDGEIIANADGGTGTYISFLWTNDQGDPISGSYVPHITGLGEGLYEVLVTDTYYCTVSASATLTQAEPHEYEIFSEEMSCNGLADGQITVLVNGGAGAGFDFDWQGGVAGNTNIATGLEQGTYFVTVTDPTSCEEVLSAYVDQPEMEDIGVFPGVDYICYGQSLILNPGTFVSYSWNTLETSQTIEVENPGVYIVNVTDENGCNLSDTIEIIVSIVYDDEELSLASVTEGGEIKLIWNKTEGQGTELYNIYKDSGTGFEHIDSKLFTEPAIYVDSDVDTDNEYYRYRISVVDSCGNESNYSDIHRTMILDVNSTGYGACFLNWASYEGFFVVYYFIESGTSPDNLQLADSTLHYNNEYVEMNPNAEGTYYRLKVRRIDGAYPGDGNYYNSAYSNIVYCDNTTGIVNSAITGTNVWPNPFVNYFNLELSLKIPADVSLNLVDMLGRELELFEETPLDSGNHILEFDTDLQPGLYILRLKVNNEYHTMRIISQ
jgi:ligand-binding sensor domain-containing protein